MYMKTRDSPASDVLLCTELFYREHKSKSFPMRSKTKGHALIINISKVEGKNLPLREGSAIDKHMMEKLFKDLGYTVSSHEDLKAPGLYDTMTDFVREAERGRATSLFVVWMSHGSTVAGEQVIYLTDGSRTPIRREMEGFFNSRSAPRLALIPKVFIIQACQGYEADDGLKLDVLFEDVKDSASELPGSGADSNVSRKVPLFCEYLFANASQPRKAAIRIKNVGSWFIRAINEVFSQGTATKHVVELFTEVRSKVSEMESKDGKVQLPETLDGLTKPFYIFPGIYEATPFEK